MIAVLALLLAAGVLGLVLLPLLRGGRAAPDRAAFDRAVYRDQLAELEREAGRGMIGPAEAAAARLEIQRRLLAAPEGAPEVRAGRSPALAVALALLAASGAGLIYLSSGAPGLPALPFAGRPAEPDAAAQAAMVRGMVERLAARMETTPDDAEGWARLGRAYAVLGEGAKAAAAYGRAGALRPDDLGIALAEAQALLEGLAPSAPFPPRALMLLRRVVAAEPGQPAALWHLGVEAAKRGAMDEAVGLWERLLAVLPEDGDDARMVRAAIAAVRK